MWNKLNKFFKPMCIAASIWAAAAAFMSASAMILVVKEDKYNGNYKYTVGVPDTGVREQYGVNRISSKQYKMSVAHTVRSWMDIDGCIFEDKDKYPFTLILEKICNHYIKNYVNRGKDAYSEGVIIRYIDSDRHRFKCTFTRKQ